MQNSVRWLAQQDRLSLTLPHPPRDGRVRPALIPLSNAATAYSLIPIPHHPTPEWDYDEAAMVRLSHSTMMIEIMRTTMVHGGRKVTGLCTK